MPLPIESLSQHALASVAALIEQAHASDDAAERLRLTEVAVAHAESLGDPLSIAFARRILLYVFYQRGAMERAMNLASDVIDPLLENGFDKAGSEALRWAGLCAIELGRINQAIAWATQAYEISERIGDTAGRVLSFSLLGGSFDRIGDPWHGEMLLRRGLELARELGEPYPLAATLNNLCAVMIGKFYMLRDGASAEEAQAALRETEPLSREVMGLIRSSGNALHTAVCIGNLGEILVHLGQLDEAQALLDESFALGKNHSFGMVEARVGCSYAELALARGQFDETVQRVQAIRELGEVSKSPLTLLRAEYAAYKAERGRGDFEAALKAFEAMRAIESRSATWQLKLRSEVMLTRMEAHENERRGLERAYAVASAHASRASELERAAHEDELTGLANRRALDHRLPELAREAAANGSELAVALVDVDHFKNINDDFGHGIGDIVLKEIASMLRSVIDGADLTARIGGEEFVVTFCGESALRVAAAMERLRLAVSDHAWGAVAPNLKVTVSVGVARAPEYDALALIERADFAMYRAKRAGRNRLVLAK